jgi:hypothetical protein
MTLDDLIESLQALRGRYPAAATAFVHCAVDLEVLWYELGEVQLEFVWTTTTRTTTRDPDPDWCIDDPKARRGRSCPRAESAAVKRAGDLHFENATSVSEFVNDLDPGRLPRPCRRRDRPRADAARRSTAKIRRSLPRINRGGSRAHLSGRGATRVYLRLAISADGGADRLLLVGDWTRHVRVVRPTGLRDLARPCASHRVWRTGSESQGQRMTVSVWLYLAIGIGCGAAHVWWRRRIARRAETKARLTLVHRLNDPDWPHREA